MVVRPSSSQKMVACASWGLLSGQAAQPAHLQALTQDLLHEASALPIYACHIQADA